MKQTLPEHSNLLQEVGLLAYRAELNLERVQRRAASVSIDKPLALPITLDEMDTIGDQLRTLSKRWDELTDRVFKGPEKSQPKTEAQAV